MGSPPSLLSVGLEPAKREGFEPPRVSASLLVLGVQWHVICTNKFDPSGVTWCYPVWAYKLPQNGSPMTCNLSSICPMNKHTVGWCTTLKLLRSLAPIESQHGGKVAAPSAA